jgi:hypothetical protein
MLMSDKPQGQSFANLPRSKKTAVILLSTIAAGILITWFWQFNSRINKPFNPDPDQQALAVANKENEAVSEKIRDTDHDGLSDFDEANSYQTSPFIEDTDGDGISDGQEIALNKDPLCPEGTDCSLNSLTTNLVATTTATTATTTDTTIDSSDEALILKAMSGSGDPASLRALLIKNGANTEDLSKISDADLMASYVEVLKTQTQNQATSTISQ